MPKKENCATLFAQITDIHVGKNNINGDAARRLLQQALEEIASFEPKPECVVATADLVCAGKREELEEFADIACDSPVPIYALPANHDLWGEPDDAAWLDLIGPTRRTVDLPNLRLVLIQDIRRKPDGDGWHAHLPPDQLEWFADQLDGRKDAPVIAAFHAPILPEGDDWHDTWSGSNAGEVLDVLRDANVTAAITGHWHRVNEWTVRGVRIVNVGALVGWQWTGMPPYNAFPVRSGYMLYHLDERGTLRSFWREIGIMEERPSVQVSLVRVADVHTGGPRPQVRPPHILGRARLLVQTCAPGGSVDAVEWSIHARDWRPMRRGFCSVWEEWEADLDPIDFRAGRHILSVRALRDGRPVAYDAVPIFLPEYRTPPHTLAFADTEMVFELFYTPD